MRVAQTLAIPSALVEGLRHALVRLPDLLRQTLEALEVLLAVAHLLAPARQVDREHLVEVGLRDGLQIRPATMPTAEKLAWLDAERAAAILASDEYADAVRAEEQFFVRSGINSVPAVIIDQQHLISGGQPVEVFERALREIVASKAEELGGKAG